MFRPSTCDACSVVYNAGSSGTFECEWVIRRCRLFGLVSGFFLLTVFLLVLPRASRLSSQEKDGGDQPVTDAAGDQPGGPWSASGIWWKTRALD